MARPARGASLAAVLAEFPSFELLDDNELMGFGADPDRSVLLMIRKRGGRASAAALEGMLRNVGMMLGEPQGWSILFDTRAAVGRSDPEFEAEATRLREYMLAHYQRVAVLVRSAIGEMQVQRFVDPRERLVVFRELGSALRFVSS